MGAILYTSYLQFLGALHEPSSHATKRVFPAPPPEATFVAGFAAGSVQSLVAAPLDALQVRFNASELLDRHYRNMWHYGRDKLREIGARGVFAGWTLSFLKESFGCAIFFATFEFMKQQAYFAFLRRHYHPSTAGASGQDESTRATIRPHFALEPLFLLVAGILATLTQQAIQFPMSRLQPLYYSRLETLDYDGHASRSGPGRSRKQLLRDYYHAYRRTFEQARLDASGLVRGATGDLRGSGSGQVRAKRAGMTRAWSRWFYRGFWSTTLRQVPSTSAGLIMFELVRRRYGQGGGGADEVDGDEVRIRIGHGADVLLA